MNVFFFYFVASAYFSLFACCGLHCFGFQGDDAVPENKGGCDVNGADDGVSQHAVSPLQPSHCVSEVDVAAPGSSMERITLHIPLNETGSAGLGVSVKGKTESSDKGSVRDLGIFVKTVLQGGAAYKVCYFIFSCFC